MAKGIAITITRKSVRREPYEGERWHSIWTGRELLTFSNYPLTAGMARTFGNEKVFTTRVEFLPPEVVSFNALQYKKNHYRNNIPQEFLRPTLKTKNSAFEKGQQKFADDMAEFWKDFHENTPEAAKEALRYIGWL